MLSMVHDVIAVATGYPSLVLRQEEAAQLATATGNLLAQFNIPITEKQQAIAAFVMTAGAIYAPRIMEISKGPPQKTTVTATVQPNAPQPAATVQSMPGMGQ